MTWVVTVTKSYMSLTFEFPTLDDAHGFLESFFTGITNDDAKCVKVEIELYKDTATTKEDE